MYDATTWADQANKNADSLANLGASIGQTIQNHQYQEQAKSMLPVLQAQYQLATDKVKSGDYAGGMASMFQAYSSASQNPFLAGSAKQGLATFSGFVNQQANRDKGLEIAEMNNQTKASNQANSMNNKINKHITDANNAFGKIPQQNIVDSLNGTPIKKGGDPNSLISAIQDNFNTLGISNDNLPDAAKVYIKAQQLIKRAPEEKDNIIKMVQGKLSKDDIAATMKRIGATSKPLSMNSQGGQGDGQVDGEGDGQGDDNSVDQEA